jgi:hypothetical protein
MQQFERFDTIYFLNLENIKVSNHISNGTYGTVYSCIYNGEQRVIKFIPLDIITSNSDCRIEDGENSDDDDDEDYSYVSTPNFLEEVKYSKQFSDLSICPKVFDTGIVKANNKIQGSLDVGYIIMEKFDCTLCDYAYSIGFKNDENIKYIMSILEEKAQKLDKTGLLNYDMHARNVVIKFREKEVIDAAFIDFGGVFELTKQTNVERFKLCFDYFMK